MGEAVANVLVVDDDTGVRNALTTALKYEGYEALAVSNGGEALAELDGPHRFDVIVLDISMPVIDGLSVCRALRRKGDYVPVLVLTARTEITDRVAGLDAGADDYLMKPFSLDELFARLRALLRRGTVIETQTKLECGLLHIDVERHEVTIGQRQVQLTKTEFDLLTLLAHHVGQVLTRQVIYERIWGVDFETSSRSLDVYISYLRAKLEAHGDPRLIHTVRGVGFTLRADS